MKTTIIIEFDRFDEIIELLPELAQEQMRETAEAVKDAAKAAAPVRYGDLRDSIVAEKEGQKAWVVKVGKFYGRYIEYGTAGPYELGGRFKGAMHPGLPPRPFLTPAAEAEKPEFIRGMEALLREL